MNETENEHKTENENEHKTELLSHSRSDIETKPTIENKKINSKHDKIKHYNNLLMKLRDETKENKEGLILYYSKLNTINFSTHVSIITLSAASTFIQSFIPEEQRTDLIKLILLSITSYSGLILAISKFYKLEEKKENSNNLRDRYADLETKINYYIDYMKLWSKEVYYKDKDNNLNNLIEKLENDYINIIDQKRELNANYEKIIDTAINRIYIQKYLKYIRQKEHKEALNNMINQQEIETKAAEKFKNEHIKRTMLEFKKNTCCEKLKYCCCNITPKQVHEMAEIARQKEKEKNRKNNKKDDNIIDNNI
tara:strand:+ start:2029 stop:2958 length:930 start_codon:yes stop_codon:yes gene_type:complete